MSIEIPLPDDEPKAFSGWDAFIKNDWTKWAEEKGIILSYENITKRQQKREKKISLPAKKPKNLGRFINNPLKDWYKKRTDLSTTWTISGYKKEFGNRRPDWARTFRERDIDTSILTDRYRNSFIIPDTSNSKSLKTWYAERELFIPDLSKKRKVVIERLLDAAGNCKKVSLIHLRGKGIPLAVRQEDWVSKGVWSSTIREVTDDKWSKANYSKLLKLKEPWSTYF